ncbi:DNA polymerase II [Alkalimarinus sediminis]|uniref:DNA polymerase n=1 Tax=Alkalimarinus sediminis TaxID=1632866 RepID=A0A9E8HLT4_9ALTE|nr:DNA polymerase II [Alkalimarinus sediminis]UZW76839.1 DNA polymerase II [Alkalimarinus sediminis]
MTNGFVLTRQWKDNYSNGQPTLELRLWIHTPIGPRLVINNQQEAIFFIESRYHQRASQQLDKIPHRARPLELTSFDQQPVTAFYFPSSKDMREAQRRLTQLGITTLEADIKPPDRYLMERFITGPVTFDADPNTPLINTPLRPTEFTPQFKVVSFDIETSFNGDHLFSIALYGEDKQAVLMLGSGPLTEQCTYFASETDLMFGFLQWIEDYDPDILIGWNCINFDLRFLERKCEALGISFNLGRHREKIEWRTSGNNEEQEAEEDKHYFVLVPGRAVLDGIDTLRSATYHFESFSLENVGRELLGRGKLIHDPDDRGDEIIRLFNEDKPALAAYNLEDCKLVWEIFEKTELIDFAIERARLTGLALDRIGGSVAAFENLYLPRLHRQGYVAPNLPVDPQGVGSPGGYVMDSTPGLYDHVIVLDFKSLYPSIIRSFKIDPYGLTEADAVWHSDDEHTPEPLKDISQYSPGYRGAFFKKEKSILPKLIEHLWHARDTAKEHQNKALSQAIKIIMNSFYGVMGTPGCRFFDPRLPSSITLRGHDIMNQTRTLIEAQGFEVIYGDTDSIFVWIKRPVSNREADNIGQHLATHVNQWWKSHLETEYQLDCALELEYENHYSKFLMPTMRGSKQGTKKRYAGLIRYSTEAEPLLDDTSPNDNTSYKLVFKGLENVRTDWTPLAREFQKSLYERIFLGLPYTDFILQTVKEIRAGQHDKKLLFRKRLRRKLADYQKNIPPHVQAARKADEWLLQQGKRARYQNRGWIEYAYTIRGPEPIECLTSPLDYDIYLDRQIGPIVDGIVTFLGQSFSEIISDQIPLL